MKTMGWLALALLWPAVATCGTSGTSVNIVFNGLSSEWESLAGVEESGSALVLLSDHAAGSGQIKTANLPVDGGGTITSVTVSAGGVTLDATSDGVQAVSIRVEIGTKTIVAMLRAYKPDRSGAVKVEAILTDISVNPVVEVRVEAVGVNLAVPNSLVLDVQDAAGVTFSVGSMQFASLSGIPPGALGLVRLDLLDTSQDKTLPSVASLDAVLGVTP